MKVLKNTFIALILILLYAPMIVMLVFSFNSGTGTAVFEGFSLRWYKELFLYGGDEFFCNSSGHQQNEKAVDKKRYYVDYKYSDDEP